MPLLISTLQSSPNIKLVLPAAGVNLGRQGTVRKDETREKLPEIKAMLEKAGLMGAKSTPVSNTIQQKSLGNIKLNIIEDWVQSGQATTTVRSSNYHNSFYKGDGVYTTDKGNLVNITYKGLVKLQVDRVVGNNVSYTKDEFAKAEGFGTWANFQKDAQYAGKTLIDGGSVHLYNITPVAKVSQPSTSVVTGDRASLESQIAELQNLKKTKGIGPKQTQLLIQLENQLGKLIKSQC
jgi:hypothetical protein